jgi:hypothetical protein
MSLADVSLQTTAATAGRAILNRQDGKGKGMVAKVRTVAFHGVEVIEVETQMTIASDPSCYLLFSGPGIEESQSVDPDPFLPRARYGWRVALRFPRPTAPGIRTG